MFVIVVHLFCFRPDGAFCYLSLLPYANARAPLGLKAFNSIIKPTPNPSKEGNGELKFEKLFFYPNI